MNSRVVELSKRFRFDSAHFLPEVPEGHRCGRMHGHSFEFEVVLKGPIDPRLGWLVDYKEISDAVRPIVDEIDHQLLNSIPGLENPTSEVIAIWLWDRLQEVLPQLCRISVMETCTTRCDYSG